MQRILIAGLGRGSALLTAAKRSALAEVAGIIDADAPRLGEMAAKHGVPRERAYATLDEALSSARADVLVVATPTRLHAEHVARGLEAGLHVLCEKPLVTNRADMQRLSDAAKRAGRQLAVIQNMRYGPQFRAVRRLIEQGAIGQLSQVEFVFRRWQPALNIGHPHAVLFNHGVHHIDAIRCMTGAAGPEAVRASEWDPPWWRDSRAGHCLHVTARMPGGWTLLYSASYAETGLQTPHSGEMRIIGSKGALEADGEIDREPRLRRHCNARVNGQEQDELVGIAPKSFDAIDQEILEGFAQSVEGGSRCETDIEDNCRTLEFLFRIEEALAAAKPQSGEAR